MGRCPFDLRRPVHEEGVRRRTDADHVDAGVATAVLNGPEQPGLILDRTVGQEDDLPDLVSGHFLGAESCFDRQQHLRPVASSAMTARLTASSVCFVAGSGEGKRDRVSLENGSG